MLPRIEPGQFVKFMYNPPAPKPKRPYVRKTVLQKQADGTVAQVQTLSRAPAPPPEIKNKNKEVFVMHPNWGGKIHALDLGRVTPAEIQVLQSVMDPECKTKVDSGQWPIDGVPNYPLIRDILRRHNPAELIKNPLAFYQSLIKPFMRDKDCYRQYWPQYVSGLTVLAESHVQGPMTNPAPLFKKI